MIDYNPYEQPTKDTVCSWEGYLYFVYEREAVRIAKENGYKGELTNDQVLHDYRFTNIRRRDDRMTQWMIKNLIKPNEQRMDLWFTMLIARLINWPPTLQALITAHVIPCKPEDFNAIKFSEVIELQKKVQRVVYGDAYLVYPTMKEPGSKKSYSMAKYILSDVIKKAPFIHSSLWEDEPNVERFVKAMSTCFGISTFIGGQVGCDLSYSDSHLGNAVDIYSYAPLGPGSQLGLNLLLGFKRNHSWSQTDFNSKLLEANEKVAEELDITDLTLHSIQNTMCEFSKYAQAVMQIKRPKRLYRSQTEY